jgi:hypothetical protein
MHDIKDSIVPLTEYSNIRLHSVLQSILDEVCYIQGSDPQTYSMQTGEKCAFEELIEYDIPWSICEESVNKIKEAIIAGLKPFITDVPPYRLQHYQLNEFEYAISIYYYKGARYASQLYGSTNGESNLYTTIIPNHWAQSID